MLVKVSHLEQHKVRKALVFYDAPNGFHALLDFQALEPAAYYVKKTNHPFAISLPACRCLGGCHR